MPCGKWVLFTFASSNQQLADAHSSEVRLDQTLGREKVEGPEQELITWDFREIVFLYAC